MMLLTNRKEVMGARINSRSTDIMGWATTLVTFCSVALVVSWFGSTAWARAAAATAKSRQGYGG